MTSPISVIEYRLARERRRSLRRDNRHALKLAEVDFKKARLHEDDDVKIARIVAPLVCFFLTVFLCTWLVVGFSTGVVKHGQEQRQATECERALAAAHMLGDCAKGKVTGK